MRTDSARSDGTSCTPPSLSWSSWASQKAQERAHVPGAPKISLLHGVPASMGPNPQYLSLPHAPQTIFASASPGDAADQPGSTRRVRISDLPQEAFAFGPTRTPLPNSIPPAYRASALSAMSAIEQASTWRQLLPAFSSVANMPANHAHLLALAKALARLAPGSAESSDEVQDIQRMCRELLRACQRPLLESEFSASQLAALLGCSVELGVVPGEDWLGAAEVCMLRQLYESDAVKVDAMAILHCAWSFQACGHTPREEWGQALAAAAQVAWAGPGLSSSAGDLGGTVYPDAVVLASGEEVQISGAVSGSGDARGTDQERLEVLPLPAGYLATLSRAVIMWGIPTQETWLQDYLQAVYYGLCETQARFEGGTQQARAGVEERAHFEVGELPDVLWGLIMSGVRPSEPWLEAYLAASGAVLRWYSRGEAEAGAAVGAEACTAMLSALSALGGAPGSRPGPEWVEAALVCSARSQAPVTAEVLCRLLFEVGGLDPQLGPEARSAAVVVAQRAELLLRAEELRERGGAGGAEVSEDPQQQPPLTTARGLASLLMGAVRCGLLPRDLPGSWLAAWAARVRACAQSFGPDAVAGILTASAEAGVKLPPDLVYELVGRFLSVASPTKSRSKTAGQAAASASSSSGSLGSQELIRSEQLTEVLEALVQLELPLPAAWLQPLRALSEARLGLPAGAGPRRPSDLAPAEDATAETVQRLSLALLQISSTVAAEAPEAWLSLLVRQLIASGGLRDKEQVLSAVRALGEHGRLATSLMRQVEPACVAALPEMEVREQAQLLRAFALSGHAPGAAWWRAIEARSVSAAPPAALRGGARTAADAGAENREDRAAAEDAEEEIRAASISVMLASFCALRSVVGAAALESAGAGPWFQGQKKLASSWLEAAAAAAATGSAGGAEQAAAVAVLLLPGLAATQEPFAEPVCHAACAVTLALGPSLGRPDSVTCCLELFRSSDFRVPEEWLEAAVPATAARLEQQQQQQGQQQRRAAPMLRTQDICSMLTALAARATSASSVPSDEQSRSAGGDASSFASTNSNGSLGNDSSNNGNTNDSSAPAQPSTSASRLHQPLINEAARHAASLSSPQVLQLLKACTKLGLGPYLVSNASTVLQPLLQAAVTGSPAYTLSPAEIASLLRVVSDFGVRPADSWVQHFIKSLLQPAPSAASALSAPTAPSASQLALSSLESDPAAVDDLVHALDSWSAQLPAVMLAALQGVLPGLSASAPETAARTLFFMSNQQRWAPDPRALSAAEAALLPAIGSGVLPLELHAPLLYSLARAMRVAPSTPPPPKQASGPQRAPSAAATATPASAPAPEPYAPNLDLLDSAVDACGGLMARYSSEHLCTIFTSLVSHNADLPPAWLDRFFDYAIPARCPTQLLPGIATAIASLSSSTSPASSSSSPSAVSVVSIAPAPWMERLMAAAEEGMERLSSRDAAVLLTALSNLQLRPRESFVSGCLDLALARSLQEQQAQELKQRQRAQQQQMEQLEQQQIQGKPADSLPPLPPKQQLQPGTEASSMAGLLASSHSTLGYVPSAEWCDHARPLLKLVLARIEDPRGKEAVNAALERAATASR